MYDEIGKNLDESFKDFPRKKAARWDLAIQALFKEKSDTEKPLPVSWLADRTGFSEPYVHNVASGKIKDPPSDKLIKIAEAFKISYPELAMRAVGEHPAAFFKTSYCQRGYIDYGQHGFAIQSLSPPGTGSRDFFVGIMTIKPLKELTRWKFRENSMVCVYVESGTIEITHGGKARRIHSNESVYFDGGIEHRIKNIDTFEARLFLVTRPPIH
jgi:mannose-6-phosphate isomerase-like protein (cupin superfamily)